MMSFKLLDILKKKKTANTEQRAEEHKEEDDERPLRGLLAKEVDVLEELRKKMGLEEELPPIDEQPGEEPTGPKP